MKNCSEQACLHCAKGSFAFDFLLQEKNYFYVVCDVHPLIEGHLLIIPKRHVSCLAEYSIEEFLEFKQIYRQIACWLKKEYGPIATFEHGKIGQTVFHSHIHLLPFNGKVEKIIPEGNLYLQNIQNLEELIDIFHKQEKYLFLSINDEMWSVDVSLGCPRFFRDRFAQALGCKERGNWKEMRQNSKLLSIGYEDNKKCQKKYFSFSNFSA